VCFPPFDPSMCVHRKLRSQRQLHQLSRRLPVAGDGKVHLPCHAAGLFDEELHIHAQCLGDTFERANGAAFGVSFDTRDLRLRDAQLPGELSLREFGGAAGVGDAAAGELELASVEIKPLGLRVFEDGEGLAGGLHRDQPLVLLLRNEHVGGPILANHAGVSQLARTGRAGTGG